jgi:hypothetical protein
VRLLKAAKLRCGRYSFRRPPLNVCLPVVQQSWSVQMIPKSVENPSCRALRITIRLSLAIDHLENLKLLWSGPEWHDFAVTRSDRVEVTDAPNPIAEPLKLLRIQWRLHSRCALLGHDPPMKSGKGAPASSEILVGSSQQKLPVAWPRAPRDS